VASVAAVWLSPFSGSGWNGDAYGDHGVARTAGADNQVTVKLTFRYFELRWRLAWRNHPPGCSRECLLDFGRLLSLHNRVCRIFQRVTSDSLLKHPSHTGGNFRKREPFMPHQKFRCRSAHFRQHVS